jgi:hypothetical protein
LAFWYGLWAGGFVHDAQAHEALLDLRGEHGGPVIGQQRAGEPAFLDRLRQTVHKGLGRLGAIPLQVTDEPRAIIEHAEQMGGEPVPGEGEHLARAVVEVQMPEPVDILGLEAADLQLLATSPGLEFARGGRGHRLRLRHERVGSHVPADSLVGGHAAQGGVLGHEDGEIVGVQPIAPAPVLAILGL